MVVSARIKVEAYTSITVAYNNSHHDSTADHSEVMKCSSCPMGNMIVAALTSNSVINCFAIDEDYCSCFDCLVSYQFVKVAFTGIGDSFGCFDSVMTNPYWIAYLNSQSQANQSSLTCCF